MTMANDDVCADSSGNSTRPRSRQLSLFPEDNEGRRLICRPYITVKGQRIYAHQKGLKAFCFWVNN